MSVVAFERKENTGEWSERELSTILAALSAATAPGTGREWETGVTEKGEQGARTICTIAPGRGS